MKFPPACESIWSALGCMYCGRFEDFKGVNGKSFVGPSPIWRSFGISDSSCADPGQGWHGMPCAAGWKSFPLNVGVSERAEFPVVVQVGARICTHKNAQDQLVSIHTANQHGRTIDLQRWLEHLCHYASLEPPLPQNEVQRHWRNQKLWHKLSNPFVQKVPILNSSFYAELQTHQAGACNPIW